MKSIIPTDKVGLMKDMAKYQSQVNRSEIMSNDNGSIFLLALKRGQALPQHVAPSDAMVLVVEGSVEFIVKGLPNVMGPGQFLLMDKDTPHAVKAIEDTKILLTLVK